MYGHIIRWLGRTTLALLASLAVGMLGYAYFEQMSWLDSFLNTAMILGGMGQVDPLHTTGGKIFAGCYALYSGLFLIVCGGLLLMPVFHDVLRRLHEED